MDIHKILTEHIKENKPKSRAVEVVFELPFSLIHNLGGNEYYIDTCVSGEVKYSVN